MRAGVFAIPVKLASGTGGYPLDLTDFPASFTLQEFMLWYWIVRRWRIRIQFRLNVVCPVNGTYSITRDETFALDPGVPEEDDQENFRVEDAEAHSANNYLVFDRTGIQNEAYGRLSILNWQQEGGSSEVRGYWDGDHEGDPGNVIPRMVFYFDCDNASEVPSGLLYIRGRSSAFEVDEYGYIPPGETEQILKPWVSGTVSDAITFQGKSFDFKWEATTFEDPAITMAYFTADITPSEYFEFSDGVTPVYDSATGAVLTDPYTAPF